MTYAPQSMIRSYDEAVYAWLGGLQVKYGTIFGSELGSIPILRTYAPATRAFAEIWSLLARRGVLNPNAPGDGSGLGYNDFRSYRMTPLPFVSFYRSSPPEFDPTRISLGVIRGVNAPSLNPLAPTGTTLHQEAKTASVPFPKPFNIPYQVDFWYLRKYTGVWIQEWVMRQSNLRGAASNEVMVTVNFPAPYGEKLCPLRIDSVSYNDEIDGTEGEVLQRYTLNLTVKAWLVASDAEDGIPGENVDVRDMVLYTKHDFPESDIDEYKLGNKYNFASVDTYTTTGATAIAATDSVTWTPTGLSLTAITSFPAANSAEYRLSLKVYSDAGFTINVRGGLPDALINTVTIPANPDSEPYRVTHMFTGATPNIIELVSSGSIKLYESHCILVTPPTVP